MIIPAIHKKRPQKRGHSSGVLCLLALVHVRVKPLAQKMPKHLCSDRDNKAHDVLHAIHLLSTARVSKGQCHQYNTDFDVKQCKTSLSRDISEQARFVSSLILPET